LTAILRERGIFLGFDDQEGAGVCRLSACASGCADPISFQPFEIKTLRVERDGTWRPVRMIEEDR
jgi:hypothetical protein